MSAMTIWAYLALYGWAFVAVPALFVVLPVRTAVFVSVIFGWLFLPFGKVDLPGPLELTKFGACSLPVLACIAVFDLNRLLAFRFALLDVPMLLWLLSPSISSLLNGLGTDDALSEGFAQLTQWGIPYLIGRLYIVDGSTIRHLAIVLFFAGIAYVPFVMWEIRMSPRLHAQIYGFVTYDHGGFTTRRLGGWRPVVFQQHGLMLGLLMASTALIGGWMWWTGAWRRFSLNSPFGPSRAGASWRAWSGISRRTASLPAGETTLPAWPLVFGLILVAVLCRALNALVLAAAVGGVLVMLRNPLWSTRIGLWALLLAPPMYFANRIAPDVIGLSFEGPVMQLAHMVDAERAESLQFRFDNEYILSSHAMQQPVFGWGGWGRNRVFDEWGNDVSITDGYWIIVVGKYGLFGLVTWYAAMMLPVALMIWRYPARVLASREAAPALVLGLVMLMFAIDCVPNAMLTSIHPLIVGGLSGLMIRYGARSNRSVRERAAPSGAMPAGVGA